MITFSVEEYLQEYYIMLVMLLVIFIVSFNTRYMEKRSTERVMPWIGYGLILCSIVWYAESCYGALDHYETGRSILCTINAEMYQVLLFIIVLTLIPHKKWIWSILLLAVNTLYSILILFNTKWTVHFTPDNQFHRGYLGYLPVVVSFILLVFILFFSEKEVKKRRYLHIDPKLLIFILLSISGMLVVFGVLKEVNTIGAFSILLYMLFFSSDRQAKTERELILADMQLYQRQIRPHFIYNGLGVIRSQLPPGESEAKDVLDHFTRYLRGNAELLTQTGLIPVVREIDIVENYLYMEKKRFEDSLTIEISIEDTDFKIPAFTVQTLVENAVIHGIRKKEDGVGTLRLTCRREERHHVIEVEDDGVGFHLDELKERWKENSSLSDEAWRGILKEKKERSHLGLINLRKRLETLCEGHLEIISEIGKGTKARVMIPIRANVKNTGEETEKNEHFDRG